MPKKPKDDDWTFMKTWMEAYSLAQGSKHVSDKLGLSPTTVTWRRHRMQRGGINLPELKGLKPRPYPEEAVAEFNTYIQDTIKRAKPSLMFACGHPRTASNSLKNGKTLTNKTMTRCRICSNEYDTKRNRKRSENNKEN